MTEALVHFHASFLRVRNFAYLRFLVVCKLSQALRAATYQNPMNLMQVGLCATRTCQTGPSSRAASASLRQATVPSRSLWQTLGPRGFVLLYFALRLVCFTLHPQPETITIKVRKSPTEGQLSVYLVNQEVLLSEDCKFSSTSCLLRRVTMFLKCRREDYFSDLA